MSYIYSENLLVSGSSDSTSRIWNLESLECLHVLEGHTDAVNSVTIKVCITYTTLLTKLSEYRMALLLLAVVTA